MSVSLCGSGPNLPFHLCNPDGVAHRSKILQGRVSQLESDLRRLCDTLPAMYDLINGAEWRSYEERVEKLLPSLKDAVSEAEDLIDEFRWYEMKVQVEGNASQSPFIEFFYTVIQGNFNKLNDVQLRLNRLSSQLKNMGLHGVTQRFDEEHPELRAGCVYYTADNLSLYYPDNQRGAGVFSLKDGREEKVEGLGPHRNKPPPAWFTLCIP